MQTNPSLENRLRRLLPTIAWLLGAAALASHGPSQAQTLSVTNGLQLWLKGDAGVVTNAAGAVTSWADQSGKANNATQADETAAPSVSANALNGKPAVHFDGDNDYLDVATSPSIEIVGDVSSFFVVKFDDFANYRAVWGKTLVNIPASTDYYVTPDGVPRVYRGSGDVSDIGAVDSSARPRVGNYVILGFEMEGTTLTHYLNDQPAGAGEITATLVDGATPLKIGSRDDLFTKMKGDIAELLIYDRALSSEERGSAISYLQTRYGITNQLPTVALTSPADNATVTAPGILTVSANASDPDGNISKVEFFANGSLIATATASPYRSQVLVQTGGPITFTARATDNKDGSATSAPVTATASGSGSPVLTLTNGLQLWLKADAGVTADASGAVTQWKDQSGKGNDAAQSDPNLAPTLQATGFGGKAALRFDGNDDYLNVVHSPSLAITGDIASFFAVRFADYSTYQAVWGKTAANVPRPTDYYLVQGSGIPRVYRGSDETGVNQFVDGSGPAPTNATVLLGFSQTGTVMTHYFNGQPFGSGSMTVVPTDAAADLKIGSRDDLVTKLKGDLAEVLIFDRGLETTDISTIATYLAGKYGIALVQLSNQAPTVTLTAPAAGTTVATPTNLTVTATAADVDGSIARVDFYADGAWIGSDGSAPYQATVNLVLGGSVNLSAIAVDNLGAKTTSSLVSITANSASSVPLPATAALQLWLKADAGVQANTSGAVTNWVDSAGRGNNAVQTNLDLAPLLENGALRQLPAVRFDGVDDLLEVASSASFGLTGDVTSFFVVNVDDFATYRGIWAKTAGNQPRPWDYYLLPDTGIPSAIRGGPAGIGSVNAAEGLTNGFMVVGFEMAGNTLTHYFSHRAVGSGTISAAGVDAGTPLLIEPGRMA
ncbi:MAG: Ig-like domain-containing protein [Verrucomicrobiota bacterium]